MQYYPGGEALRSDAGLPSTSQFQFDLTQEEWRLCDWVAQQGRAGVRHIRYADATAALDLLEDELTRMLWVLRERRDEIHAMVEAPIVNTQTPYFEIPLRARHIWDSYRRAEREEASTPRAERRPGHPKRDESRLEAQFELVQS